jgi:nicotinamide-nucleotide amidase
MNVTIIAIGDELLRGRTLDTNSHFISGELFTLGFNIIKRLTIPDKSEVIIDTFNQTINYSDIIITTGGLGPTSDDKTLDAISVALNLNIVEYPKVRAKIDYLNRIRNKVPPPDVYRMARLPEGSIPLENSAGVAPGVWLEIKDKIIIILPGVPKEMESILKDEVIPRLKQRFEVKNHSIFEYSISGIPESILANMVEPFIPEGVSVAYLPSNRRVLLHIEILDDSLHSIELTTKIESTLGDGFYAKEDKSLESHIQDYFIKHNITLATAESCTGGWVGQAITEIPGSSKYYLGGVIAYSNQLKTSLLNVPTEVLIKHGAVSAEVAEAMAIGAKNVTGANWVIATTGIAGPDGETPEKPVGLVFIAVAGPDNFIKSKKLFLLGNRETIRDRTVGQLFDLLRRTAENYYGK